MAKSLPKDGITLIIEGLPSFIKAMDTIAKKVEAVENEKVKMQAEDKEEEKKNG